MIQDTLGDAIDSTVGYALANLHTATIAKVTKVTGATLSVKPVFNRVVDDESVELPEFAEVPILWFSGGGSSDRMPIAVGDYALLIFIERCIDDWVFGKDNAVPREPRLHDYSDAVAIVGLFNNNGALAVPTVRTMDGNIVHNGNMNQTGNLDIIGMAKASVSIDTPIYKTNGEAGTSGVFSTADIKTITVKNGIITSIA